MFHTTKCPPTYGEAKTDTLAHQYQNTPLYRAGKNNMYFRKAWCMCAHLSSRSLHMAASVPQAKLFHTALQTLFYFILFSVHRQQNCCSATGLTWNELLMNNVPRIKIL